MAHFMKPLSGRSSDYNVDNKLAPGSISEVRIPLGESRDVELWGADRTSIYSDNPDVVPNDFNARRSGDVCALTLSGRRAGTCLLKAGPGNVVWVSLLVRVAARTGIEPAMSAVSARLSVLTALADPAVKKINVTVDGFSIRPENYARVREAIIRGSVIVRFNGSLKNPQTGLPYCRYFPYSDTMELGFINAPDPNQIALIIHEATHAACDIEKFASMKTTTSEILGYVAQAVVMKTKSASTGFQEDPIIFQSQILAEKLLTGSQLRDDQLIYIRRAIEDHPDYKSKAGKEVDYDGVRHVSF